jgi:hypothetical protein
MLDISLANGQWFWPLIAFLVVFWWLSIVLGQNTSWMRYFGGWKGGTVVGTLILVTLTFAVMVPAGLHKTTQVEHLQIAGSQITAVLDDSGSQSYCLPEVPEQPTAIFHHCDSDGPDTMYMSGQSELRRFEQQRGYDDIHVILLGDEPLVLPGTMSNHYFFETEVVIHIWDNLFITKPRYGGTDIMKSLKKAVAMTPPEGVIAIVSDGDDRLDKKKVGELVGAIRGKHIRFYWIKLNSPAASESDSSDMAELTALVDSKIFKAQSKLELRAAFADLALSEPPHPEVTSQTVTTDLTPLLLFVALTFGFCTLLTMIALAAKKVEKLEKAKQKLVDLGIIAERFGRDQQ